MNDYIKRDDAENIMLGSCDESALWKLRYLPSADVVEVRHGHWKQDGHHVRCSECGTYFCITDREGDSFPINYCPCCGAKMDGDEK